MRQRRFFAFLLAAALLLALSACGGTQPGASSGAPPDGSGPTVSGDTQEPAATPFTLAVYPEYSLHPTLAANRANLTLAPLLYEPLFQVDSAFQAVPVLCQSHSVSGDKLTWTFTLRSNVTFSDGTPLTGEAVAAALNTARSPGARYETRLRGVAAVTAEGNTVTISLSRPNGSLPLLLDIPIALGSGDRPAGTGPYVLSGTGDALALTARPGWWQQKPLPIQEIPLQPIRKSDELIFAFDSGDISLVDVDLMGTNALGYSGNYEVWDYPTTDFLYVGFNTQRGICRTPEVRQALALAVDRTAIAQTIYANHAVPAALPVHPASSLYDDQQAAQLAYAPERLVAQLEDLRALGRELTFLVNNENSAKVSAAQFIAYQLESAGMQISLEVLPFEDYSAALAAGDFDLYLGEVVLTADFDLSALLAPEGALNYGGWDSGEVSPLLSALASADSDGRPAAAGALFDLLKQQVPITPICFKNGSVLTQWGRLSNLSPVRGNVFCQLENWTIPERNK